MVTTPRTTGWVGRLKHWQRPVLAASVAAALLFAGLLVYRAATGQGLGLRSLPRNLLSKVLAVRAHAAVAGASTGQYTNLIFLHHSTGEGLVLQGKLRQRLAEAGFALWDHSFNQFGLRDPAGRYTGYSYVVPRDNTDPDGLARIFAQPAYSLPLNTFSALLQHEVIILKSCFLPANYLTSDQQVADYQAYYLSMRDRMDQYPGKLFILMTTPPVNPAETTPAEAQRARRLAGWLASDEFTRGHPNVVVYDFYTQLAENDPAAPDYGMLRAAYRDGSDSHPNALANQTVGPALADFVVAAIEAYRR